MPKAYALKGLQYLYCVADRPQDSLDEVDGRLQGEVEVRRQIRGWTSNRRVRNRDWRQNLTIDGQI